MASTSQAPTEGPAQAVISRGLLEQVGDSELLFASLIIVPPVSGCCESLCSKIHHSLWGACMENVRKPRGAWTLPKVSLQA